MKVSKLKGYRDSIEIGKKIYKSSNLSGFDNISKKKKLVTGRFIFLKK